MRFYTKSTCVEQFAAVSFTAAGRTAQAKRSLVIGNWDVLSVRERSASRKI